MAEPDVADGGEARLEGLLGVGHADDGPEIIREFQASIAVVARIDRDVSVHVDQPRQQSHARQIDAARALRHRGALIADGGDAAVDDGDLRMIDGAAGNHVDHAVRGNHDGVGVRRGGDAAA